MQNDRMSIATRVIEEIGMTIYNPDRTVVDPSPLHHGTDSRLMAETMLARAEGDRRLALKIIREDIKRRYPGFKAVKGFPGHKEWMRVVRMIYTICPTVKKKNEHDVTGLTAIHYCI